MLSRFCRLARLSHGMTIKPMKCNSLLMTQYRELQTINVGDLLKKMQQHELISVSLDANIRKAAQIMEKEKIGALIVDNDATGEQMVGIVTARDVQQAVAEYEPNQLPNVKVKDVMTGRESIKTATTKDNLEDVATRMTEFNIRHIPVMNSKGENTAILSIKDVVRVVLEEEKREIKAYERIVMDSYSAGDVENNQDNIGHAPGKKSSETK